MLREVILVYTEGTETHTPTQALVNIVEALVPAKGAVDINAGTWSATLRRVEPAKKEQPDV